jgi:hypothetical protein
MSFQQPQMLAKISPSTEMMLLDDSKLLSPPPTSLKIFPSIFRASIHALDSNGAVGLQHFNNISVGTPIEASPIRDNLSQHIDVGGWAHQVNLAVFLVFQAIYFSEGLGICSVDVVNHNHVF